MMKESSDDYGFEDYKTPESFEDFEKELKSSSSSTQDMLNPHNKNLYTWVIGIAVLVIIAISSGGIYLYQKLLDEKNDQIKRLQERDCSQEIKKYIEIQNELMRSLENQGNRNETIPKEE